MKATELNVALGDKATTAIATLAELLEQQTPLIVPWSAGKDSSCVLSLVLIAARLVKQGCHPVPPIRVLHGDTKVESPEIHTYAYQEMAQVKAFAQRYGLDVSVHVAKPGLAGSWAFRHIGAGKLFTYVNAGSRDCSVDLKVTPLTRLAKSLTKQMNHETGKDPVTVIGTRFEESASRKGRMTDRGETAKTVWEGPKGGRFLSPICDWDMADVWELLGRFKQGIAESYSDFEETFRIYADATDAGCAVVADMALGQQAKSRSCGARHGCWACVGGGRDKSMEAMLENDARYEYMRGLNRLQRFMVNTQYDWSRRDRVGRTLNAAGYVMVNKPDLLSSEFRMELLRYALTLDIEEAEAADKQGIAPRFQIIDLPSLIAIDAIWSRDGIARPFSALKIYRDIARDGARYPVPEIPFVERTPMPEPRYLYVGNDWLGEEYRFAGLRNLSVEAFAGECLGQNPTRELSNGQVVTDNFDIEACFDVDEEGAEFVMMDMDHLIDTYHNASVRVTYGWHHYLQLGTLTLSASQVSKVDQILRRTAFREEYGLAGAEVDITPLLDKTIDAKAMKAILETANDTPIEAECKSGLEQEKAAPADWVEEQLPLAL